MYADTIAPEAACTSVQFHLQVSPQSYASQLERGPVHRRRPARARGQLAVPVRQGAVAGDAGRAVRAGDRHPPARAEGAGRAAAGVVRRAVDHLDLRPVRGERLLLPGASADLRRRGPGGRARAGATRRGLGELRMHNGTIYRWNRPVYDVFRGKPHLRVENRVLPAGPTVVDILANGAFYYGAAPGRWPSRTARCGRRCRSPPPRTTSTPGPGRGIDAQPLLARRRARCRPPSWCCAGCCPLAHQGLGGVGRRHRGRAIACSASSRSRCTTHQNGAEWQARTFHRIDEEKQPLDRRDSLREMLGRYVEHMHSNEPVHSWPVG